MNERTRRVGFTGTRHGMTPAQREALRALLRPTDTLHHGDCVGADADAHEIARAMGCRIAVHPGPVSALRAHCAGDVLHEPRPFLDRNVRIVLATEILIAAPRTAQEKMRSGTRFTVREARRRGREVIIIRPDGTIWIEHPEKGA